MSATSRLHRAPAALALIALAATTAGCPRGDTPDDAGDAGPAPFSDAACGFVTARFDPPMPGVHVAEGTPISWNSNPPSSGTHFPVWAHWGVHTDVVPRGYYVHNLEHGGVALLYRCDGDCSAVRRDLEAIVRALPPEPACGGTGRRVLLTEDPLLDAPVAAAAWGYTYRAMCVDPVSLQSFILGRTGMAPEDLCADGDYPSTRPDAGNTGDATASSDASDATAD